MYEQVENSKDKKSKAVANPVAQKKSSMKKDFGFVDNRPETIVQKVLFREENRKVQSRGTEDLNLLGSHESNAIQLSSKTAGGHSMGKSHSKVDGRGKATGHGRKSAEAGENNSEERRRRMIDKLGTQKPRTEAKTRETAKEKKAREQKEQEESTRADKAKGQKMREQERRRNSGFACN